VQGVGWGLLGAGCAVCFYLGASRAAWALALSVAGTVILLGATAYLRQRPAARELVWPAGGAGPERSAAA
jgi:hypothetical protein